MLREIIGNFKPRRFVANKYMKLRFDFRIIVQNT